MGGIDWLILNLPHSDWSILDRSFSDWLILNLPLSDWSILDRSFSDWWNGGEHRRVLPGHVHEDQDRQNLESASRTRLKRENSFNCL